MEEIKNAQVVLNLSSQDLMKQQMFEPHQLVATQEGGDYCLPISGGQLTGSLTFRNPIYAIINDGKNYTGTANKAIKDINNNNIIDTYATIEFLNSSCKSLEDSCKEREDSLALNIETTASSLYSILTQEYKKYTDDLINSIIGPGTTEAIDTIKEITDWITKDTADTVTILEELASIKSDLSTNYLPLAGGTMSGEITLAQGEGKGIQLGKNGLINATSSSGTTYHTVLGMLSEDALTVGHTSFDLFTRGKQSNLMYNNKALAFDDDVLHLTGGTLTGDLTIDATSKLINLGTAADAPIITRGIRGANSDGTAGDLYLQNGQNYKVYFGSTANSSLNADGTITEAGTLLSNKYAAKSHSHTYSAVYTGSSSTQASNTSLSTLRIGYVSNNLYIWNS